MHGATSLLVVTATLGLIPKVLGTTYSLQDNFVGNTFFTNFDHIAESDPTHGRVNYVPESTARALNLSYASDSPPHFVMRADSTTTLNPSGPGRNSVRIMSKKQYGHNTVLVADVAHMPQGCGTWPALWSTDVVGWPARGEIDIIEGVNDVSPNQSTLHTTAGCTQTGSFAQQSSAVTNTDCNYAANGNAGCGVQYADRNSYGPGFNQAGGGWYAMERTPTTIKIWFWSRFDPSVPLSISTLGTTSVDTSTWGLPNVHFTNTSCDIQNKFGLENIIINLTFCGDWAGQQGLYQAAGCPGTCINYVNSNPSAFREAYWDFRALRTYALSGLEEEETGNYGS